MPTKSPISNAALKYVRALTKAGLIRDEHSLTVSLLKHLVEKMEDCTSAAQVGLISKEIRATIDMLPKPTPPQPKDKASEFMDDLEKDD